MTQRSELIEKISYIKTRMHIVKTRITPPNPNLSIMPPQINYNYAKDVKIYEDLRVELDKLQKELDALTD
jgi:hypothetical protein